MASPEDGSGPTHAQYSSTSQVHDYAAEEDEHTKPEQIPIRDLKDESREEDGSEGSSTVELGSEMAINTTHTAAYTTNPPQSSDKATPTMEELTDDFIRCCITSNMTFNGEHIAACFENASEQPPITPDSLAELDLPRIINNPRLRYDVNFDRELHFRPNLDGSKGREKIMLAENFWKALEGELFMYGFVQGRLQDPTDVQGEAYWKEVLSRSEKRLPKVLDAMRDILKTLVPDYDQNAVSERLDTEFTMQEIKNGVCDLVDLANWLAKILKNHCAPMRDPLVDRMQAEIKRGASEGQSDTLVNGIRQLLTILEAMKLDVANHQIRHMRVLLVDDTINFQQRYNAHRISIKKVDTARARQWLDCEVEQMISKTGAANPIEALTAALLRNLLFDPLPNQYPPTFYLDSDRLQALRTDLHSAIYQDLCRDILVEVACSPPKGSDLLTAFAHLKRSIQAIVGSSGKYEERIDNIAAEIMRITLSLEGRDYDYDADLLVDIQDRLTWELRIDSTAFMKRSQEAFDRLVPKLHASVTQHVRLPALHLQDRLVPPVPLPPMQPPTMGFGAILEPAPITPANVDPDDDAIRKLTHMIVLHWQVWANLVYLAPPEDEDGASSSGTRTPPSPSSAASTVPVATAVYAPGRKWLPIGVKVEDVPSRVPSPSGSSVVSRSGSPNPLQCSGSNPLKEDEGGATSSKGKQKTESPQSSGENPNKGQHAAA